VGTGFNPDLTGRDNIFLNGAVLGMTKREISSKFDEIVDFSGVEKFINTPVKRYSSGMYVRLAFAVAAHLESEILILDEVLAVGDAEFQRKCLNKMDDVIHKQGRSILFVSHSMGSVKDLCTRAIYLKKGQVFLQGDTQDVIKYYVEENMVKNFSAQFSIDDPTHRRGFGHARYHEIKLFNTTGVETHNFLPGEEVIFRLKGIINDKIDDLYASIAFRAGKGNEIITSTKKEKVSVQGLHIGDEFIFSFKLNTSKLRPGAYNLYFWLGSRNNENPYDVVDSLTKPLIIDIPPGHSPIFSGYFNVEYNFEQYINDRVK
jgi:lipopolysaccharide transport system ATP-binding protein